MNYLKTHKEQFEKLFELYMDWNSKINLSAIRDREGVWEKHFEDSLLIYEFFDLSEKKVLDLGAGGGFPTLPLALTTSSSHFVALDSVGKKMKVVADMANQLELKNVETIHGRFEDFGQDKKYREQFDVVTARAVAPWKVLLEYALPFVKVGGSFIAYQGPEILNEINCHPGLSRIVSKNAGDSGQAGMTEVRIETLLGGEIGRVEQTTLGDAERVFVEVKKVSSCSKKYPRENGLPRQEPLIGI